MDFLEQCIQATENTLSIERWWITYFSEIGFFVLVRLSLLLHFEFYCTLCGRISSCLKRDGHPFLYVMTIVLIYNRRRTRGHWNTRSMAMISKVQARQCQRSLWHEAGRLKVGGSCQGCGLSSSRDSFSKFEKKYFTLRAEPRIAFDPAHTNRALFRFHLLLINTVTIFQSPFFPPQWMTPTAPSTSPAKSFRA
jgi:hypothetical protein